MNVASAFDPRRITIASVLERLRELDAVAVRIEDVDDPHLPGQLEHGADLDALAAQPVGVRLHVVDVDHRHARLRRLALRERDLHRAALELRELVLPVDVRLVEAQQPLVEVAAAVEVADEVPDPHSASAGSSTNCLTVRRKSAPSAPSTARWSTVRVMVM